MFNYHSTPVISTSTLLAHAILLKSASASARLELARRQLNKTTTPTTTRTASILPFLKKHARQPHDVCDDTSCASSSCSSSVDIEQQNPAGKRQRRQAAATLVQNLPSWTGVGKKSKAQPRPQVHIPPKGIGPIAEPNQNDVLCGRGGR
jgi:hypothetical protein